METYTRSYEAIQFEKIEDIEKIAEWCGGNVEAVLSEDMEIRQDVAIITVPQPYDEPQPAVLTNYIVKDAAGYFFVVPETEFKKYFEKSTI